LMIMVASCGLLPKPPNKESAAPSVSVAPTLTERRPPDPNYTAEHCGVSKSKKGEPSNVLLTIDDFPRVNGVPHGERMVTVADWARQAGVMMEAFPIKSEVDAHQKATNVDLVAELRARGTYVSNHSFSHPELSKLKLDGVEEEIRKGVRSTYLRPPYGSFSSATKQTIEAEGYRMCLWSVDTNDWRLMPDKTYPSPAELVRRVREEIKKLPAGTPVVILGHYSTHYPEALELIVEEVERMGSKVCRAPSAPVSEEVPFPIC
jgi:peptidoglycan-N-acetylglucosamine deacetylase